MKKTVKLSPGEARPAGIKDIAKALGVSIGTVDRALHSRGRISSTTRDRILQMAKTLGYRPNLAARYLKAPKQLRVSVHLPLEISSFYDDIRLGIRTAAAPFESAVDFSFRSHPILGEGEIELFQMALDDGSKGIILAPGHPESLRPWIHKAATKQIPVVCVSTDAPGSDRLTVVSTDPYTSGAIAGEFLGRCVSRRTEVAVLIGDHSTVDHSEKLRGFQDNFRTGGKMRKPCAVLETHDTEELAYASTKDLLRSEPRLSAIYVSTANSLGAIRAAEELDPERKVALMTTSLFPEMVGPLRSGRIVATIHQHPQAQGKIAFEVLYRYLTDGKMPAPQIRLNPHIVMRSNVDLFIQGMPFGADWNAPQ